MSRKESVVVTLRIPAEVYSMLKCLTASKREHAFEWLKKYGPVYRCNTDITEGSVAKELLINAIGRAYTEEKNAS